MFPFVTNINIFILKIINIFIYVFCINFMLNTMLDQGSLLTIESPGWIQQNVYNLRNITLIDSVNFSLGYVPYQI